jgi:tol-pal system protein YbgF
MNKIALRNLAALTAASMVAVFTSGLASAQTRLSLAERVQLLEQKAQSANTQSTQIELLNRLNALQQEVQELRGLVEQQNFEIEGLKKRGRDQYLDLDSRIQALGRGAAPVGSAVPQTPIIQPGNTGGVMVGEPMPVTPGAVPVTAPAVPATPLPTTRPPIGPSANERADYDKAFAVLKNGRYDESARQFAAFVRNYPDGQLVDNATYWLGESYYVTQNFKVSLSTFQGLLNRFPNSLKAPDAMLKVGYCYYEMGDPVNANKVLTGVVNKYPDTPVAKLAQSRLQAMRLEGGR